MFGFSRGLDGYTPALEQHLVACGVCICKITGDDQGQQWQWDMQDIAENKLIPHIILGSQQIPSCVTPAGYDWTAYQVWLIERLTTILKGCGAQFSYVEYGCEQNCSPDAWFNPAGKGGWQGDVVALWNFNLYKMVVQAVEVAESATGVHCLVGGPGAATYDVPLRLAILCAKNNVRLDFVSWHHYTQVESVAGLSAAIRMVKAATHAKVYLSEFGASPSGDKAYNLSQRAVLDVVDVLRRDIGIDEMCMLFVSESDGGGWYCNGTLTPWAQAALNLRT